MSQCAKDQDIGYQCDNHLGCSYQEWLERTPGLEVDGFNFWGRFEINIFDGLNKEKEHIEVRDDSSLQDTLSLLHW